MGLAVREEKYRRAETEREESKGYKCKRTRNIVSLTFGVVALSPSYLK